MGLFRTYCAFALGYLIVAVTLSGCTFLFAADESEGTSSGKNCSGMAPLWDDFSSSEVDRKWLLTTNIDAETVYSQGQEGAVFVFPDIENSFSAALTSRFEHDMRDGALSLRVDQADARTVYVALVSDVGNGSPMAMISLSDGELEFLLEDRTQGTLVYDPDRDIIWRIRDAGGTLHFETGPSEQMMVSRAQTSAYGEFVPSHVRAMFGLSASEAGRVVFGSVNQEQGLARYCTTSALEDGFDSPDMDSIWRSRSSEEYCSHELDGDQLLVGNLGYPTICSVATMRGFDFEESVIELRFSPGLVLPTTSSYVNLNLAVDNDNYLQLRAASTGAVAYRSVDDELSTSATSLATEITAMRLRHDGERIHWEVDASEGLVQVESQPAPFDLYGMSASIGVVIRDSDDKIAIGGVNAD